VAAPVTERATLIRRLYFDRTGLPGVSKATDEDDTLRSGCHDGRIQQRGPQA
jgi:hypothetical protein